MSGDNSPWVSHISVCLMSRGTSCLCSGLSFKECLHSNSLGTQYLLAEKSAGLLRVLEHEERCPLWAGWESGMLSLYYLSWVSLLKGTHCMRRSPLAFFISLCENCGLKNWHQTCLCSQLVVLWVIYFFLPLTQTSCVFGWLPWILGRQPFSFWLG